MQGGFRSRIQRGLSVGEIGQHRTDIDQRGIGLTLQMFDQRRGQPNRTQHIDVERRLELSVVNGLAQIVALNTDGKRKRLLLAGSNLEDAVTFECLEALAYGFDVFLPSDLIEVSDFNFVSLHWDRLKQAGAVPTTIIQMLNEWSLCATDAPIIEKIRLRSEEFRKIHK